MSSHTGQTDAGSIDRCGEDLQERPILLGETRLEVQGKLELGNLRNHVFPVLSGSGDAGAGRLCRSENIRPELGAIDRVVRNVLDSGPVLSRQQEMRSQPIGNGLLADGRVFPEEIPDALSKEPLAASDFNRPFEGGNVVRLFHDPGQYTNRFVERNNPVCVTGHKSTCIVLSMQRSSIKKAKKNQRTRIAKPTSVRRAVPFADGKTLGDRIKEAMAHRSHEIGSEYTQAMLIRDLIARYSMSEKEAEGVQQTISAATRTSNTCRYTPGIAALTSVDAEWLSNGYGTMLKK